MLRLRRSLSALVVLVVVLTCLGYPVYVRPRRDRVTAADPADAIVVLGGVPFTSDYGYGLLQGGVASRLVISNAYPVGYPTMVRLCPQVSLPGVDCFVPDPFTTRGEAQELGRLARANRWDDVIVVAPVFQISRARVLIHRCYPGRLRMVAPEGMKEQLRRWPYDYAYQTSAYIKTALFRDC